MGVCLLQKQKEEHDENECVFFWRGTAEKRDRLAPPTMRTAYGRALHYRLRFVLLGGIFPGIHVLVGGL